MRKTTKAPQERIDNEYQHYIDSLKTVIKRSEETNNNLQCLKRTAIKQEDRLHECMNDLKHLETIKKLEQQQWQIRAQQLELKKIELQLQAEQHSQALAYSKAELEHGLRMINLFPNSSADDYLQNTSSNKTINDALKDDWSRVGDEIAMSLYKLRKTQDK